MEEFASIHGIEESPQKKKETMITNSHKKGKLDPDDEFENADWSISNSARHLIE